MALRDTDKAIFETLQRACRNNDLALMECQDAITGEYRAVICAVNRGEDGSIEMIPLGHLATGNPFEQYIPPATGEE